MARKPTGRPTGRPLKNFDQNIFEGLCRVWCTLEDIENIMGADSETITRWCKRVYGEPFAVVYKKHASFGRASLRRNQLNLSKTNATMCIWLGKQYLGQKDVIADIQPFNGKLAEVLDFFGTIKGAVDLKPTTIEAV